MPDLFLGQMAGRCDSRQVKSRQVKGTEEPSSSYQRTTVRAGLKSTKLKDKGKDSLNTIS